MPTDYGTPRLRMYPAQIPPSVLIQRPNNNYNLPVQQKYVGSSGGYNKKNYHTTAPAPMMTGVAVSTSTSIPEIINTYPQVPQIPVASAKKRKYINLLYPNILLILFKFLIQFIPKHQENRL